MKKGTTETFIEKANIIHNFEYDYSLVNYVNSYTKVKIICSIHGVFEQRSSSHLRGQKCIKCVNDNQTNDTQFFIEKANSVHNFKYNYSKSKYINNKTIIKIICPIHDIFEQKPSNHLSGSGCIKCRNDNYRNIDYINKCNLKFENKFDYSLVNYVNNNTKVKIICPTHGVFEQTLKDHFNSNGCPYCSGKKMNTDLFIEKSNKKHNNYYKYSLSEYKGAFKKIKIICPIHGIFEQVSSVHLFGSGCPICKSSKGEKNIISLLNDKNIKFIHQHKFNNCKYINDLIFDFYLPEKNMCIEYNGIQHYKPIDYFGGEHCFNKNKKRDNIKKKYCKNNNIKLKIITYRDNIDKKINHILNE